MSCCTAGTTLQPDSLGDTPDRAAVLYLSQALDSGEVRSVLSAPDIHCGACITTVEKALNALPCIQQARVNLSTRRVVIHWRERDIDPALVLETMSRAGFPAHFSAMTDTGQDTTLKSLILALGVAGFAAGNIMLLSVSVWSGAEGSTRDLFHWISALIAIPTIGYSGQIFFRPAFKALAARRLNMDVPISLAVLLAVGMSLYETATHGPEAYFDASVTLLFFLLIGRTLDHVMRERARGAVAGLGRLMAEGATVITDDGQRVWRPLSEIEPGMTLALAAGDRIPVDCQILDGTSDIDSAIVTGESIPTRATVGDSLTAGSLNLTGPLTVVASQSAKSSFLAEMIRMLEAAESARPRYRQLSDRAAAIYAPVVHIAAALTFIGWMVATGDWHRALLIAIAVLIITCPCALGLAVPIVQVVAAARLFRRGIMLRDGAALERLARVDHVVFDKTGTLTHGIAQLQVPDDGPSRRFTRNLSLAAALALASRHPYSQALVQAAQHLGIPPATGVSDIQEFPGDGIEAVHAGQTVRLGRAGWVSETGDPSATGVVLSTDGTITQSFQFSDQLRPQAQAAITELQHRGMTTEVLSGDTNDAVSAIAGDLGIADWQGDLRPGQKVDRITALRDQGHHVLMVGDGLNDTPSLAAADVAMVPAKAMEVGRQAAGLVFLKDGLDAVPFAIDTARRARRMITQNFTLAILYNAIAIPLAVAGFASPLVAAIAMSSSSILVTLNAMRLAIPSGQITDAATTPNRATTPQPANRVVRA